MIQRQIKIIYHANCADGFAAALAAWLKFGNAAEYISAQYGSEPPDVKDCEVYILDFSYKREILEKMASDAYLIKVLDHHKTAKSDLDGLDYAYFDMDKSGCALAWEYFHTKEMPMLFKYIQDRDLWKFDFEETKAICEAIRLVPFDFKEWEMLINDEALQSILNSGRVLLLSFDRDIKALLEYAYEVEIKGIKGLAVNTYMKYASELGNQLAQKSGTFGLIYAYKGETKEWLCSLRSIGDFDVSTMAKQFNGGGHKNAAGFSTKDFIF